MKRLAWATWLLLAGSAGAQETTGFLARYQARVAADGEQQPHWTSPLITASPRLEQGFRSDFTRQSAPRGQLNWNYGGSRGVQILPLPHFELRVSPPPFFTHSGPKTLDGFGDFQLRLKYRIAASNEQHHNAIATLDLSATLPTGKNGNGSCCATVSPAADVGKGFGRFAFTFDVGGTLPVTNTKGLGRSVFLNEVAQAHPWGPLWLQVEFNSTVYEGGKNDRQKQTFATPGVIFSRLPLVRARTLPGPVPGNRPQGGERLAITLGAGEQIALTHFNTYNHALVFTSRLRF